MFNTPTSFGDEDRVRRLLQKLTGQQTDVKRLWQRVGQTPDNMGAILTGLEAPSGPSSASLAAAYTPAQAPTTTVAPTTTTTTTPAPATAYLYPIWDFSKAGNWSYSSGSTIWDMIEDSASWPDHAGYVRLADGEVGSFSCWLTPLSRFSLITAIEAQIYCKNELSSAPLTFTAQVIGDDQATPLTDSASVPGVGTSEGSYSLRTVAFTPATEAQEWGYWARPTLGISLENDTEAGTPHLYISAARVKVTYIPEY